MLKIPFRTSESKPFVLPVVLEAEEELARELR